MCALYNIPNLILNHLKIIDLYFQEMSRSKLIRYLLIVWIGFCENF